MKKLFIINDTLSNRISYYHLMLFLIFLPFDRFYTEIILISFFAHTLINLKKQHLQNLFNKQVIVIVSLYLATMVATIYTSEPREAFNEWGKQITIALIPVLLAINALPLEKYKLSLLKIFAITCTITVIYLYVDALRIILYNKLPINSIFTDIFINHNFSSPINMHATYLSMYVALSIFIFIHAFYFEKIPATRMFYIIAIFILFSGLLQLSSRATFISVLFILILGIPFLLKKGTGKFRFTLITSMIVVMGAAGITRLGTFKSRYIIDLKKDLTVNPGNTYSVEPRIKRWAAALEIIRQSPFIGNGTGTERKLLKEKYFEKKLYIAYLKDLNAHNQYLSFMIKSGIFGCLIYLYVIYFGFVTALKKKDFLFFSFLMIISIVSVSENILDVNKGIFFFSFLFSVFLFALKPKMPAPDNI